MQKQQLYRDARRTYEQLGLYDQDGFVKGGTKVLVGSCEEHDPELVACTEGVNCPTKAAIDPSEGPFADRPWVKLREIHNEKLRRCVPKKLIPLFEIANLERQERKKDPKPSWLKIALGPATKTEKRIREATEAADKAGRIYAGLRSHIPPSCGQAESRTQCYAVREKGIAHPSPTGHHQKCFWKNDAQVVNGEELLDEKGQCLNLRNRIKTGTYYPHIMSREDADEMDQGSFRTTLTPSEKYIYDPGLKMHRPIKVTRTKREPGKVALVQTVGIDDEPLDLTNYIIPVKANPSITQYELDAQDLLSIAAIEHPKNARVSLESLKEIYKL